MGDPFERPQGDINPVELRVATAALAGPMRLPFGGSRRVVYPGQNVSVQLLANRSEQIIFTELRTVSAGPATVLVGYSASLSANVSLSFALPGDFPLRFLVYPGETLFMQSVASLDLIVHQVRV